MAKRKLMKTDKPKGITTIKINTLDELMPLLYNRSANADYYVVNDK